MISKISPNFAHHGRYRECDEIRALRGVESIDCLHQTDAGDLDEVVERFAASAEMAGYVIGQWQASGDDHLALMATCRQCGRKMFQGSEHREDVLILISEGPAHGPRRPLGATGATAARRYPLIFGHRSNKFFVHHRHLYLRVFN